MKRFVCSDIIPGCSDVFTGEDDQSVLDQVIAHAAADHGLVKPPLALVELVVATTHTIAAPRKNRHLRLVGAAAGEGAERPDVENFAAAESAEAMPVGAAPVDAVSVDAVSVDAVSVDAVSIDAAEVEALPVGAGSGRGAGAMSSVVSLPTQQAGRVGSGAVVQLPNQDVGQSPVHPGYRHECLLYSGTDELLRGVVPFMRDGLRLGEAILVAIAEPRQRAVREALGDDESRVVFADMTELANPARIIPAVRQFVAAHPGRSFRGVGEPIWAGRRAAEITEAQLHESLMDVALAFDTPMWVVCPYDITKLDAATIDEAHRSHSAVVHAQTCTPSAAFGGAAHAAATFRAGLAEPSHPIETIKTGGALNTEIAADVLRFATARGLSAQRSVKLAAVVDEITTAGVRQTGQDIRVRLWGDETAVVCEVADRGVLQDPMVGRAGLHSTRPHDRDIRLANELCDLVQVRSDTSGTTVRIHSWL